MFATFWEKNNYLHMCIAEKFLISSMLSRVDWTGEQGDQIRRMFAYWEIVLLLAVLNYGGNLNFWATPLRVKSYVLILGQKCVGPLWGLFFTTSSGHSACEHLCTVLK
jgi:hypothetical protein